MENQTKIIRAAIYIRVSTEEQARHGYSLNSQKERLVEYCKQNKYKIIGIYPDEGKSARCKMNNRKELLRLIEDVKLRKIDRIVFWRLDRWFRNVKDYYKIQDILEKNKVDWECSDEEYNTLTSNGRLHLNIKLSIAQNESDQTGDRIKFNFESMVKNKRAIQGSHCMPLGYKVVGEKKNKYVVKDENVTHIVEDMFEHFNLYGSVRKTLIYINNKYDMTINYYSMCHYFRNELYTGKYKNIIDYCEPYISKETFTQNQIKMNRNVRDTNKKYNYIFSGLLKCSCCGYNLAGFTQKTTKPKYGKQYEYHAYRCNRAYGTKSCKNVSPIIENHLEKYLIENLEDKIKNYIIEIENIEETSKTKQINTKKLEEKLERINDLYIEGRINKEKYDTEYRKINIQIEEAKKNNVEHKDLNIYKELLNSNGLQLYNKLNNDSKRAFWYKYIDFIERNKDLEYVIHFR